ncbi:MAG: flagellar basal body rod protein FlgB [Acidimicrobiales bacterium]
MAGISDNAMQSMQYAMSGLTARAELRANNIANAETPGFLAKQLDFESTLKAALENGDGAASAGSAIISNRNTLPNIMGNTVELELETTEMLSDDILYQAMINGWNAKARNLRIAMGSS